MIHIRLHQNVISTIPPYNSAIIPTKIGICLSGKQFSELVKCLPDLVTELQRLNTEQVLDEPANISMAAPRPQLNADEIVKRLNSEPEEVKPSNLSMAPIRPKLKAKRTRTGSPNEMQPRQLNLLNMDSIDLTSENNIL